jgi:hypothetical protein
MDSSTVFRLMFPRKPLRKVVPETDELIARPGAVLASREVVIGPMRMYRLAAVCEPASASGARSGRDDPEGRGAGP